MTPKPTSNPKVIKPKTSLHPDVKFIKGRNSKGLPGGAIALFPKMQSTTNSQRMHQAAYWEEVEDYLMNFQPNNAQGLKKAQKMQRRLAA